MRCVIALARIGLLLLALMSVRAEAATFQLTTVVTELRHPTNPFDLGLGDPIFWTVSYDDVFLSRVGEVQLERGEAEIHVFLGSFSIEFPPNGSFAFELRESLPSFVPSETASCSICSTPFITEVASNEGKGGALYADGERADIERYFPNHTPIPEPSRWLLLGSTLLGFGLARRRLSTAFRSL